MEIEENIVSLDDLMENKEKLTFQYSQKLEELSEVKDKLIKDLEINKKDFISKNKKKFIKLFSCYEKIEKIFEKNKKKNYKQKINSRTESTKIDSDSN